MAVTLEYAKCDQCGDNNVKTAELCRKCQAILPWSKAAKKGAGQPAATRNSSANVSLPSLSNPLDGISTGFYVQILGGFIVLCAIGYYAACFMDYIHFVRGPGHILLVLGGAIWRRGAAMG